MRRCEYTSYIDMSVLPTVQYRQDHIQVDWKKVIGMQLPFKCGSTSGKITFLDKNKNKVLIKREIDDSKDIKIIWITKSAVLKNNLSNSIFNEIAFTCPDLLKYFVNKEDAYRLVKTSQEYALCKCPICGHIKSYTMAVLHSRGFSCDKCSDKSFKYPNKFMMNILDDIKANYRVEVTKTTKGFEWLNNYRYDFLVIVKNQKYFIEMDGYFHYNDNLMNGRTAKEQQKIDLYKDSLANQNGYNVIRINCCYKNIVERFSFIKNNIITSGLLQILGTDEFHVHWNECDNAAMANVFYEICSCWNAGMIDTKEISKKLGVSRTCVYDNLLKGTAIGFCNYDSQKTKQYKIEQSKSKYGIPVVVFKNDKCVGVFSTIRELSRQSLELYGKHFNIGNISYACRNIIKTCYGYVVKKISHEEYEQLYQQHKINELNFQEVSKDHE